MESARTRQGVGNYIRRGSQGRRTLRGRWEKDSGPTPLRKAKEDRNMGGESCGQKKEHGGKARQDLPKKEISRGRKGPSDQL